MMEMLTYCPLITTYFNFKPKTVLPKIWLHENVCVSTITATT
jgi:hypothetical protein